MLTSVLQPDPQHQAAGLDPHAGHELVAFVEHVGLPVIHRSAVEQVEELQVGFQQELAWQPSPLADAEVDQVLKIVAARASGRSRDEVRLGSGDDLIAGSGLT